MPKNEKRWKKRLLIIVLAIGIVIGLIYRLFTHPPAWVTRLANHPPLAALADLKTSPFRYPVYPPLPALQDPEAKAAIMYLTIDPHTVTRDYVPPRLQEFKTSQELNPLSQAHTSLGSQDPGLWLSLGGLLAFQINKFVAPHHSLPPVPPFPTLAAYRLKIINRQPKGGWKTVFDNATRHINLNGGRPKYWNNLGYLYKTGLGGIRMNPQEAFRWIEKAANGLEAKALYKINLAALYYKGTGTPVDRQKAYQWFCKALKTFPPLFDFFRGLRQIQAGHTLTGIRTAATLDTPYWKQFPAYFTNTAPLPPAVQEEFQRAFETFGQMIKGSDKQEHQFLQLLANWEDLARAEFALSLPFRGHDNHLPPSLP